MMPAGYVTQIGEVKSIYKVIVRNPKDNRPLARSMCTWEGNVKSALKMKSYDLHKIEQSPIISNTIMISEISRLKYYYLFKDSSPVSYLISTD
jgi:hypothetical protein